MRAAHKKHSNETFPHSHLSSNDQPTASQSVADFWMIFSDIRSPLHELVVVAVNTYFQPKEVPVLERGFSS